MPPLPLFVSPGDDLVARFDDFVIFAKGDVNHLRHLTNELAALVAGADWTGLLRFFASKISTIGFDAHPPVACVQIFDESVNTFVFGDITLVVETSAGTERISGSEMTTWREVTLTGKLQSASVGSTQFGTGVVGVLERGLVAGGGFTMAPESPSNPAGSMLNAISGATTVAATAQGGAVPAVLGQADQRAPEPVADTAPDNAAEIIADASAETVPETTADTDTGAEAVEALPGDRVAELGMLQHPSATDTFTSELATEAFAVAPEQLAQTETIHTESLLPAPIVEEAAAPTETFASPPLGEQSGLANASDLHGILCPNGHLTSAHDPVCRTCSAPVDADGQGASGPRPILGVIEFDDGVRIPLDHPVVIGRQPPEDYHINGEPSYVVPITDTEGLISRVHVEVHLVGWDVELVDKNSVNGTFISTGSEPASRTRLASEHPTRIEMGTIIYAGDRVFRLNTGRIV